MAKTKTKTKTKEKPAKLKKEKAKVPNREHKPTPPAKKKSTAEKLSKTKFNFAKADFDWSTARPCLERKNTNPVFVTFYVTDTNTDTEVLRVERIDSLKKEVLELLEIK